MSDDSESKGTITDQLKTMVPALVTEFIGTFFFAFFTQLAVHFDTFITDEDVSSPVPAGVVVGLVLMVLVYAGGPLSGGHYNPAVSLACLVRTGVGVDALTFFTYVFVQVLGSFTGASIGFVLSRDAGGVACNPIGGDGYSWVQVFLAEFVFTQALAYVVLETATNPEAKDNSYFGISIGLTVSAGALCVGNLSGAMFNPALATGLLFASAADSNTTADLSHIWIYWAASMAGGALAGAVYRFQQLNLGATDMGRRKGRNSVEEAEK